MFREVLARKNRLGKVLAEIEMFKTVLAEKTDIYKSIGKETKTKGSVVRKINI